VLSLSLPPSLPPPLSSLSSPLLSSPLPPLPLSSLARSLLLSPFVLPLSSSSFSLSLFCIFVYVNLYTTYVIL